LKIIIIFVLGLIISFWPHIFSEGITDCDISSYDSLRVIEKVYLHTDRHTYYPGDDIWFKAYLIDASDRLLSDHSNNLHVEIISPESIIIDSRIVKINDGLGNGDFHLSEKLQSGRYRLRAYTNYMRNFGDQLFFNKEITVINSSDAVKVFSDSSTRISNKPEIRFFPEGGSLVENVTSVIAFKAEDSQGNSFDVSGVIYSSSGEKVTEFKSTHNGMGTFLLKPGAGLRYYALSRYQSGDSDRYEIPESMTKGVILNVSKNDSDEILLTFKTNSETLPLVLNGDLSLTVSEHNEVLKTFSFRMKSLNNFLNIPVNDLPDGIVQLTLTGPGSMPLCERLVYIQNREDIKIDLGTDKSIYNQRDSVSVKVSLKVNSQMSENAFLSFSATKDISGNSSPEFPSTITSWFLLESDVRGPVEDPSYYFDSSNADRLKDLDLLLLTQGWRDFKWKYENPYFKPETGFTISGRLRKKFADVPLQNARVNIAIFKKGNPLITTVPADSTGRFNLEDIDFNGDAKLVASITGDKNSLKGWLLLDSAGYSPAMVNESMVAANSVRINEHFISDNNRFSDNQIIKKNLPTYIQYAEISSSIQKKYKLSDTISLGAVTIIAKRQDKPESARVRSQQYLMALFPDDEYVVSPKSEAYRTLGHLISVKLHMNSGNMSGLAFNNPLILLDGLEVGWEGIMDLPVEWIERFDGLKPGSAAAAAWGEKGRGGVISVITRTGALLDNETPVYHSANTRISGYNEPRIFYSPKHHSKLETDYKPDLRTTIFWEPNVKLENSKDLFLNYFNADNPSKVKVVVEGITTTGVPVTGQAEYEVK
jgi:hypothetical protein